MAQDIKKLSVYDTIHDFGKELSTNRYYRAFLSSQNVKHILSPEGTVERMLGMMIDEREVKNFETLNINEIFGRDKFCLLIKDLNNEAFKVFLGTLIFQNEGNQRIQMITDTTNLSQATLCSIQMNNLNGTTIVTDATKFDRGRSQVVDGKCVQSREIPASLNSDDGNLFALNVIQTLPNEVRYGNRQFTNQINLTIYTGETPGKLPYYIRLIKQLHQGSLRAPPLVLRNLLKDLEILYGLRQEHYLNEQGLANILFDIKRSGDQLQVITAQRSNTLFASNDRISATYAKILKVPTIRTSGADGYRLRKFYFYNFNAGNVDDYVIYAKEGMVQKINDIINQIESFNNLSDHLNQEIIAHSPMRGKWPFLNKIASFINTMNQLRNLNPVIFGERGSERIRFNENTIQLFKCITLWEAGEYIGNILYFLLYPVVKDYRTEYAIFYKELVNQIKFDLEQLTSNPATTLQEYQHFLEKISVYDYSQIIDLTIQFSRRELILDVLVDYIRGFFGESMSYDLELNDLEDLKFMEDISQGLINGFGGIISGIADYKELLSYFGTQIKIHLIGPEINYQDYVTEFVRSDKVKHYKAIIDNFSSKDAIYNSMIIYIPPQTGGRIPTTLKEYVQKVSSKRRTTITTEKPSKRPKSEKLVERPTQRFVKPIALWKHYQSQYVKMNHHEAFYDDTTFANHFLNKLRMLSQKPLNEKEQNEFELLEVILVFLIKMNLLRDRELYYDNDSFLSSRFRSSTASNKLRIAKTTYSKTSHKTTPRKANTI